MGVRLSVRELIQRFGQTYRSIDLRTAAVLKGDSWANALTVVRLTYEEPDAARERLLRAVQSHGQVMTEHFRIVVSVRPFSHWEEFLEGIRNGVLQYDDLQFSLRQPITLEEEQNQLQSSSWDIRTVDNTDWPALNIHLGPHQGTELSDERLVREIGALGYPEPYEAINLLCDVSVRQGQSHGYDFYLSAPIFILITDARVVPREKQLAVTVKMHRELRDMKGVVFLRGRHFTAGQAAKARLPIPVFQMTGEETITAATGSVELPEIEPTDWIDVKLMHTEIGEVDGHFSREVNTLIPQAERNVLYEVLKRFCPRDELEEIIVRPHARKPRKLDVAAAFERRVAWLLGLLGCPTIVLGEYEHLVVQQTKVRLGSVDILAVTPSGSMLLLVGCTLGALKEEDFGSLLNVRGTLEREVFASTTVHIQPVVFTAAAESPTFKQLEGIFNFIPIINAAGLEATLALIASGQERRFFEFLTNPKMSPLKKPPQT